MVRPFTPAAARPGVAPIRVLTVDDSVVVRGLISRWLEEETGVELAGAARDGEEGVAQARALQPDVIVLDVEMPRLDGLSALPRLRAAAPQAKIVMASGLTRANAEVTVKALAQGAADYIAKPSAVSVAGAPDFRRDLVTKIRALGRPDAAAPSPARVAPSSRPAPSRVRPEAVFIGASTGGPMALRAVLTAIASRQTPVFITQHMPATFTTILADQLNSVSARTVVEARDGMAVAPGHGYLAPGDHHMTVRRRGTGLAIALDQRPPEHFCRPAVDPMLRTAAAACGAGTLAVVLTGMGRDGAAGAKDVVAAGGTVLAQDAATSVVWGMPGAVEEAGLAAALAPLDRIGPMIINLIDGKAP